MTQELVDPCLSATVLEPTFTAQTYTISDVAQSFDFASDFTQQFSVTPSYCPVTLVMTTNDSTAQLFLENNLSFDSAAQTLTLNQFFSAGSLALSGNEATVYDVTFTYTVTTPFDSNFSDVYDGTMQVTVKNPCIDSSFVHISQTAATLATKDYVIDMPAETWDPHPNDAWTVVTQPATHSLCGDILLTPKYEGGDLSAPGTPITYDASSGDFTVQSDRADLIDTTKAYSLVATLTNWPPASYPGHSVTTETRAGVINFANPCDAPFTFAVPTQDAPGSRLSDNFSVDPIRWTLTPFTIAPSRCTVSYACDSVTQTGEAVSSVACADLAKDLTFNGDATDGVVTLDSAPATYGNPFTPGTYVVTIRGTVVGSTQAAPVPSITTTFSFTLTDPCDPPASAAWSAPASDASYTITQSTLSLTQPAFVISPAYCPYTLTTTISPLPGGQTPLTNVDDYAFTVYYDADNEIEGHSQTVTRSVVTYTVYRASSEQTPVTDDFVVSYLNPCVDPAFTTVTATTQTDPPSDSYDAVDRVFTYNPYTVVPAFCPLTVTCEGVTGPESPADLSCPTGDFNATRSMTNFFDGANAYALIHPGDYVFTFKVSTGGTDASLNPTFIVTQVLVNPCDNDFSINVPSMSADIPYTVTQATQTFSWDSTIPTAFEVDPSFCEKSLVMDAGDFSDKISFDPIT